VKDWLTSLEARERLFVAIAVVFVVFAIGWFGIWSPLDSGQKSAAERVAVWKNSLSELRPLRAQLQTGNSGAQAAVAGQNQSLVVIVDATLRQRGLMNSLQRSQPTPGGDGIRVEFENAAFDDLILWLGDLNRQYGLQVQASSFSVTSNENQGRVNSTLTLER
jgi:general secretion pathway protein M